MEQDDLVSPLLTSHPLFASASALYFHPPYLLYYSGLFCLAFLRMHVAFEPLLL